MKPSEQCKAAGLKSLAELSKVTGESVQTLINWHRDRPIRFEAMILYVQNVPHETKEINMPTPYEKLGYPEGQKFVIGEGHTEFTGFKRGTIVTISRDDGTDCPLFETEDEDGLVPNFEHDNERYVSLKDLQPVEG